MEKSNRGGYKSGGFERRDRYHDNNCKFLFHHLINNPNAVQPDQLVVVKMRGLNYHVRYEEVTDFFKDYNPVQGSVILGKNHEGKKNGFGAILFESEDKAAKAATEMNKQYLGSRYLDLSVISYDEYLNFNPPFRGGHSSKQGGGNYGSTYGGHSNYGGNYGSYVKLQDCVSQENLDKSLILRGLPYSITTFQVQKFLNAYGEIPSQNIFIEEFNGKRSGSALVVFESEKAA